VTPTCGVRGTPEATYRFTAPFDGSYSFDTLGSSYDTLLAVLDGDCSGAVLGCNDNAAGAMSRVITQLGAGDSVVVAVDGASASASGAYQLNLLGVPISDCLAIPLPLDLPLTVTGTTVGADAALMSSCTSMTTFGPEVVYGFTAPLSGAYSIDTFGSGFDTFLYVLDGGCSGGRLDCNNDTGARAESALSVRLSAGQTVAIVVDGYNGDVGDYVLNIHY
jgi:lysophospholipid acyltransferase (LPLAT)-like uncharacterized protein